MPPRPLPVAAAAPTQSVGFAQRIPSAACAAPTTASASALKACASRERGRGEAERAVRWPAALLMQPHAALPWPAVAPTQTAGIAQRTTSAARLAPLRTMASRPKAHASGESGWGGAERSGGALPAALVHPHAIGVARPQLRRPSMPLLHGVLWHVRPLPEWGRLRQGERLQAATAGLAALCRRLQPPQHSGPSVRRPPPPGGHVRNRSLPSFRSNAARRTSSRTEPTPSARPHSLRWAPGWWGRWARRTQQAGTCRPPCPPPACCPPPPIAQIYPTFT